MMKMMIGIKTGIGEAIRFRIKIGIKIGIWNRVELTDFNGDLD